MLTRSSVHWADSMVATKSSKGLECTKAHQASGYVSSSRCKMASTSTAGRVPGAAFRGSMPFASVLEDNTMDRIGIGWYNPDVHGIKCTIFEQVLVSVPRHMIQGGAQGAEGGDGSTVF